MIKRALLGLALTTLLNGCAGVAAIQSSSAVERYVTCNSQNAMRMAASEGNPADLVMEAEAACTRERLALARVYERSVGADQARVLLDGIRQGTVASNAATIAMNGVR
jgi:hypothetical protein